MSIVTNIGNFPHTISGLINPPNKDAPTMQGLLEQDCNALWEAVQDMVDELNSKVSNTLDYQSTDDQLVTAKAVFDLVTAVISGDTPITPKAIGAASLDTYGKVKPEQSSARVISYNAAGSIYLNDYYAGGFVMCNMLNADWAKVYCPLDTAANLPVGTEVYICQAGTNRITIEGQEGVTVNGLDGYVKTPGQYGVVCVKKVAANSWLVIGGAE